MYFKLLLLIIIILWQRQLQNVLFCDNLIIRLVLAYWSKKIFVLNKANCSSSNSSLNIQLSSIYLHLWKKYKHIFCVFLRKQEFPVTYFCWESKGIKLRTLAWKVHYCHIRYILKVLLRRNFHIFFLTFSLKNVKYRSKLR